MSSHDMSVRATLKVKPGVKLQTVWSAVAVFTEEHQNDLVQDASFEAFGEIPMDDVDDSISLTPDGTLHLYLSCHGPGGGLPNELESLLTGLDRLVSEGGGVVEIIDHDTSASNEEAISIRFVGSDDHERMRARLTYGLELSKEWLIDVLGVAGFDQVAATARQIGNERIAALPSIST